jgi:hypothetical protein
VDNTNQSGSSVPMGVMLEALQKPGKTNLRVTFEAGMSCEAITERLDAIRKLVESLGRTMTVESAEFVLGTERKERP